MKRCAARPTIDGKLDDACWVDLEANDVVHHFEKPARREEGHTFVRLCYDDRGVYVSFDCREPHMEKLRTVATERDADLWEDDCVEVFFHRADEAADSFRQWMISAAGVVYDGDHARGESWNSRAVTAAARCDDRYIVELAIRWQDLGGAAPPGTELRANFMRNRATDGNRYIWSWQYDGSVAFRAVAKMGSVRIED